MFKMEAIKGSANSDGEGLHGKSSIRFDNSSFTTCLLGFNQVEPGTFDWHKTNQDMHSFSCLFDHTIM